MRFFHLIVFLLLAAPLAHAQEIAANIVTAPAEGAQFKISLAPSNTNKISSVRDTRSVSLAAGRNLLRFLDVPTDMRAPQLLTGTDALRVLQQKYRNAESSPTQWTVLRNYLGKPVTVLRPQDTPLKGTLLSIDGVVLLDTGDGIVLNPPGTYMVPRGGNNPAPTVSRPSIEWLLEVAQPGQRSVEARYMTEQLSWAISYRASLDSQGDATRLNFTGWLTIFNGTGNEFNGAQISLQGVPDFGSRALDIPRESVELPFATVGNLPVTPELIFYAALQQPDFLKPHRAPAQTMLRLQNSAQSGLGVTLPAGPLMVYSVAEGGALQSVPASDVPLTRPNERLWIPLGRASDATNIGDVIGERSLAATRQLNPVTQEHTIQIVLTNTHAQSAIVAVVERLPVGAKITDSSVDGKTIAPTTIEPNVVEFKIPVPANGSAILKYVVEVKS